MIRNGCASLSPPLYDYSSLERNCIGKMHKSLLLDDVVYQERARGDLLQASSLCSQNCQN